MARPGEWIGPVALMALIAVPLGFFVFQKHERFLVEQRDDGYYWVAHARSGGPFPTMFAAQNDAKMRGYSIEVQTREELR